MKPVVVKFNHWLPKLLGAGAITLGHTIYFRYKKSNGEGMNDLFRHECQHVLQVERDGLKEDAQHSIGATLVRVCIINPAGFELAEMTKAAHKSVMDYRVV